MYIDEVSITNYKSFKECKGVELQKGFNIIVGKNNSGKTALIEACRLEIEDHTHKSPETIPSVTSTPHSMSTVEAKINFEPNELKKVLINRNERFTVPYKYDEEDPQDAINRFKQYVERGECSISAEIHGNRANNITSDDYEENRGTKVDVRLDDRSLSGRGDTTNTVSYDDKSFEETVQSVYFFEAERQNVGRCARGTRERLLPNSSNLAEVLDQLQSNNPARFDRFVDTVRQVVPSVKYVTATPEDPDAIQVNIWNVEKGSERQDLAIPLSHSGTGIGQVLAILYVILNSDDPRIIIIDEPQSFLHPGAVRRLIGIMKENPEHQYIMTTHAPSVITAADPSNLLLTRRDGVETKVDQINVSEKDSLRRTLAEIGVRLSDVFGADSILWVEGPTEELCFPRIIEELTEISLLGTEVVGVRNPGDFEGRYAEEVVRLYKKLARGQSLIPPAVGFLFDREKRSQKEINDLQRLDERVSVTKRRMYENYLLHPEAISAILTQETEEKKQLSPREVENWIEEYSDDIDSEIVFGEEEWYRKIDAASMLKDLFSDLSNIPFEKTNHVPKLTDWIIRNSPSELREISEQLETLLKEGRESQGEGDVEIAEVTAPVATQQDRRDSGGRTPV